MANKELECPCCGGTLHFDSHSQDIVCPFCDSHFSVDDLKAYTDDLATDKKKIPHGMNQTFKPTPIKKWKA